MTYLKFSVTFLIIIFSCSRSMLTSIRLYDLNLSIIFLECKKVQFRSDIIQYQASELVPTKIHYLITYRGNSNRIFRPYTRFKFHLSLRINFHGSILLWSKDENFFVAVRTYHSNITEWKSCMMINLCWVENSSPAIRVPPRGFHTCSCCNSYA